MKQFITTEDNLKSVQAWIDNQCYPLHVIWSHNGSCHEQVQWLVVDKTYKPDFGSRKLCFTTKEEVSAYYKDMQRDAHTLIAETWKAIDEGGYIGGGCNWARLTPWLGPNAVYTD